MTSHSKSKLEIYRDKRGKFRWRVTGDNNEVVGASTQGFSSKQAAQNNIDTLFDLLIPHTKF